VLFSRARFEEEHREEEKLVAFSLFLSPEKDEAEAQLSKGSSRSASPLGPAPTYPIPHHTITTKQSNQSTRIPFAHRVVFGHPFG